jgi:hypothetical protein
MADAAEDMTAQGGAVWKDLFSGAVGGIAQVMIGRFLSEMGFHGLQN